MDQIRVSINGKDKNAAPVFIASKPQVSQSHQPKQQTEQQPEREAEEIKQLSAKLHPEYDEDLIKLIKLIPKRERSKIYRDALRKYLSELGIK
jgi:acyl-coenzyme A synthetase/AMP-(fatty) acid ligase